MLPVLGEVSSGGLTALGDKARIELFCLGSDASSSRNSLSFPFPPCIAPLISIFCWLCVNRASWNKPAGSWLTRGRGACRLSHDHITARRSWGKPLIKLLAQMVLPCLLSCSASLPLSGVASWPLLDFHMSLAPGLFAASPEAAPCPRSAAPALTIRPGSELELAQQRHRWHPF